jgi:hypothetical protein
MRTTIVTAALVLLVLALMYSLVKLDMVDAEVLRFAPSIMAVVVACAIIYSAVSRRRSRSNAKRKKRNGA